MKSIVQQCAVFAALAAWAIAQSVFAAAQTTLTNPIAGGEDIRVIVGMILKGVLGLTGTIALIVFIYGGFQWLLARGESGEVKKGLDTMLWAGVGLIVIFGSYAILQRVFEIIPG
ncbi:MAG: hypothetical protein AAB400_04320 [Patescibacteria group bacterium]